MFILTSGRSSPSPLHLPPLHLSSNFTSSLSIFPSRWRLVLELGRHLPQSGKKLSLYHFRVRMIAEVGIPFADPEGRATSQRPHLQSQPAYPRGNAIIKSILPYRELNLVSCADGVLRRLVMLKRVVRLGLGMPLIANTKAKLPPSGRAASQMTA